MTPRNNLTKDDCLKILQKIAEKNPKVQRAQAREWAPELGDRWAKYFGTWHEFRAAAGLELTRGQTKLQNDIARHSSLDDYKILNEEKRNWGGKFLKPTGARFQNVLLGMDVHDIHCDPFWRKLFVATAKRAKPDIIVLNGDIFDLPEFSKFNINPVEWDVVGRIKWVHSFLKDLREAAPDATIYFNEGNHEYRLLRHLAEATPALRSILSDLHGFTIPKLLGLEQFEINYIAPADLATLTQQDAKAELRRNWINLFDCFVAHHFPEGSQFGMAGVNGHHHRHEVRAYFSPVFDTYEWHQFGSGHKREASYCNGEMWGNGFGMAFIDTLKKRTQIEYYDTTHDHCVIGGEYYHRDRA